MGLAWTAFMDEQWDGLPGLREMAEKIRDPAVEIPAYYYAPIHAYKDGTYWVCTYWVCTYWVCTYFLCTCLFPHYFLFSFSHSCFLIPFYFCLLSFYPTFLSFFFHFLSLFYHPLLSSTFISIIVFSYFPFSFLSKVIYAGSQHSRKIYGKCDRPSMYTSAFLPCLAAIPLCNETEK
jgi:hypothetical protein